MPPRKRLYGLSSSAKAAASLGAPLRHQRKNFFDENLIEFLGFLERRVMRRLFEPYESLAGRFNCLEVCLGQHGGDMPIVAPKQKEYRYICRDDAARDDATMRIPEFTGVNAAGRHKQPSQADNDNSATKKRRVQLPQLTDSLKRLCHGICCPTLSSAVAEGGSDARADARGSRLETRVSCCPLVV